MLGDKEKVVDLCVFRFAWLLQKGRVLVRVCVSQSHRPDRALAWQVEFLTLAALPSLLFLKYLCPNWLMAWKAGTLSASPGPHVTWSSSLL